MRPGSDNAMKPPVVLVIRKDDRFSHVLRNEGCEVLNLELIRTIPAADLTGLDNILVRIEDYDGLFFTSPMAAEVLAERLKLAGYTYRGKVYVLGERARMALEDAGFDVIYHADANTAEELIASFAEAEFDGKRLLFVRGNKSQRTIPNLLGDIANVDEVVVYETTDIRPEDGLVDTVKRRFGQGEIDWVCFFSPSGVERFRRLFDPEDLKNTKVAAIGETTAAKAKDLQISVDLISQRATAEDFAEHLIGHIKNFE